ncbi:AAA family ATPase [Neisseria canis]|uniref:ABC transporter ATP-binding protein-like protein n=1 Tax=Neisseria canis TaxID=493 RepID=A0A448D7G5_9NEIS|nr:AAA family ATPase [Neisseria canis]OSI12103.1 ABC transporter ATP-binding protein [Neisseria canis]VEF00667.1 ABC transporter ATP-binding protein-like protein [Neisseria canis]
MFEEKLNIAKKTDSLPELKNEELTIKSGETTIIIGANGSGKTKLAVYLEEQLGEKAHRISAHRALNLDPSVDKIPENRAKLSLMYGNSSWAKTVDDRKSARWNNKLSTSLLNDFNQLLQYLFAQQNNLAVANNQKINQGIAITESETKLDKLKKVWELLLPHKKLHLTADDIQVSSINTENSQYSASEMSDGERAVFYILGQVLSANENSILIFDEPELHIHKSIISNLWDKVEELRPDCAFIMITHDIEFAATRAAKKYVIHSYYPDPAWNIAAVPDSEFDEQTVTLILGSRKPILFVEGGNTSLDIEIYRHCYPEWTIIPKGSCKDVIQAVSSLDKLNQDMPLLNIRCAGIVDRDTREQSEIDSLNSLNIKVLAVSEIENIFSLTSTAKEILKLEGFRDVELEGKLAQYKENLLDFIKENLRDDKLDKFVIKRIQRHIDRYLKNINLSASYSSDQMKNLLISEVRNLANNQIEQWISEMKDEIETCFNNGDIDKLLEIYESKGGLLNKTASILKSTRKDEFEKWLIRQLKNQESELLQVIKQNLPSI